jgi:GNAT superfamily N-acetyltransferase
LWIFNAYAKAPFYQGKTIRIIVGTPPGNLYDLWARLIVAHMGKHIPGNPEFIVQNMPGAGHVVAANHLFSVAKPDGLTLIGSIIPSLYLNQLIGRSEIQFDCAKFTWIGSPARGDSQMYMRADTPYKTIEDVRIAKEPPKCGATGVTGPDSYLPKLLQDTVGAKFTIVTGYPGGTDIDLLDIETNYQGNRGCFDVLEDGAAHIVGSVGIFCIGDAVCELRKMYLLPEFRGQGHGKRLLEHALARARGLGYSRVILETASVLERAINLYARYGFKPLKLHHLAARCDQARISRSGRRTRRHAGRSVPRRGGRPS